MPVEELDKKNYSEILEESILNIQRFTNEWTDFGAHDPGITILEMLTWLTDMQRYYLNRITQKNKLKYLKLYGINLEEQKKSKSYVEFECTDSITVLPKGTKLKADEQIFETAHSTLLTNNSIKKAISVTEFSETDNTHAMMNKTIAFYPFEKNIKDGNMLYIAFEQSFDKNSRISLFFDVADDCLVKLNETDKMQYHINYEWLYFSENGKWEEMQSVKDETNYFTENGNVILKIANRMAKCDFFNDGSEYHWICIKVKNSGVNISPKIKRIALNYVPVINQNTLIKHKNFKRKCENVFYNNIFYSSDITVQYKTELGYVDLDKNMYTVKIDGKDKSICICDVEERHENLRIIGYDKNLSYKKEIGKSNGLPCQSFYYPTSNIVACELVLQAAVIKDNIIYWNDYSYVRNFETKKNMERVFELNFENQEIVFGNNENSIIPEKINADMQNIRIIGLVYSNKERGNIKSGEIKEFVCNADEYKSVVIKYAAAASGGKDMMHISDGIIALEKDKNEIYRAVSIEDYEKIAKYVPGLRISHTKAAADMIVGNKVNIVAVPFTGLKFPVPDNEMINIVRKYLDKFRLITTRVEVVAPKYIGITVTANISVMMTNKFDLNELKKKLFDFLTPINADKINFSYIIGEKIFLSEIIKIINGFENVNHVDYIRIDGRGEGVKRDSEGNLILPYNGICYSDNIEINTY